MADNNYVEKCAETNVKTKGKLEEYGKDLSTKIKDAASASQIAQATYNDFHQNKVDQEKCYDKLKSGYDKYKHLSIHATSELAMDTEELYQTITKCNSEVKVAVNKNLKGATKALKTLKDGVKSVNEAACKLKAEISDNCNAQQLNILRKEIIGSCDNPISPDKGAAFDPWIEEICAAVDATSTSISELQNIMVSAAGVNALVDYTNLEAISKTLMEKATELNDDVEENIDASKKSTETACTELTDAINALSTKTYEERKANLRKKSLYKICHFIGENGQSDEHEPETWDDMKEKINNLLCKKQDDPAPTPAPKEEDGQDKSSAKKSKKDMG